MATTLYSSGPVSHDFTVVGIRENSRLPDTVDFEGHYWVVNGLPNPPHSLRELLQPGDTIRLHGTGNRWGVFYTEIELIKQE